MPVWLWVIIYYFGQKFGKFKGIDERIFYKTRIVFWAFQSIQLTVKTSLRSPLPLSTANRKNKAFLLDKRWSGMVSWRKLYGVFEGFRWKMVKTAVWYILPQDPNDIHAMKTTPNNRKNEKSVLERFLDDGPWNFAWYTSSIHDKIGNNYELIAIKPNSNKITSRE